MNQEYKRMMRIVRQGSRRADAAHFAAEIKHLQSVSVAQVTRISELLQECKALRAELDELRTKADVVDAAIDAAMQQEQPR